MKILSRSFYAEILALQGFPAGLRASYFIRDNSGYSEIQDNQTISIAGNKRGFVNEDGTKTRSGLFFDALRIIEHCKPKVAVAENVKNLTSKSMSSIFSIVLESLDNAGYNCYWQVLNSADYGMPQGRERVFIVSIRKDVDDRSFRFPPVIPLEMCMGDLLDEKVPAEFYLSEEKTQSVIRHDSNHPGHIADRGGRVQPYCQGTIKTRRW